MHPDYQLTLRNAAVTRKWRAAAWLLGASYRDLGMFHSCSHASILQSINKELPKDRLKLRLALELAPSALAWYYNQFQANVTKFRLLTPEQIAQWLTTNAPFPGD